MAKALDPACVATETTCRSCGKDLPVKKLRRNALFCSQKCRSKARPKGQATAVDKPLDICTGTRGALSELLVSADLIKRGFDVFRALSPACPCDLVVIAKDGRLLRIEVRTANETPKGTMYYAYTAKDVGRHDVLALVLRDQIIYKPEW